MSNKVRVTVRVSDAKRTVNRVNRIRYLLGQDRWAANKGLCQPKNQG